MNDSMRKHRGNRRTLYVVMAVTAAPIVWWAPATIWVALVTNMFIWMLMWAECTREIAADRELQDRRPNEPK